MNNLTQERIDEALVNMDENDGMLRHVSCDVESTIKASLSLLLKIPSEQREALAKGWQPIETAPKDGTNILVSTEAGGIYNASWKTYSGYDFKWRLTGWEAVIIAASYWMPLFRTPHQFIKPDGEQPSPQKVK